MAGRLPILIVDDEETDVFFLRLAIQKAGLPHAILVARDGEEAVDYLGGAGVYADRDRYPLPRLVLLDLHMPRMSGFDLLAWRKQRPELKDLPMIVLTSSLLDRDREQAREFGAADYRVKPCDVEELMRFVEELRERGFFSDTRVDSQLVAG